MENFEIRLASFVAGCQAKINDHYTKCFKDQLLPEVLEVVNGSRYVKIVARNQQYGGPRASRAYCFVDKTNGNVLKAASWKTPAKHARGNIFDDDNGLSEMNHYGANYLR